MNEEILIELGEVSEETKGCRGFIFEGQDANQQPKNPDGTCPT